jgi:predicted metal-dependent peptidase
MNDAPHSVEADGKILTRIAQALRRVTVPFPHLSGLAAAVRPELDDRVPTMGIFASGRLLINRAFSQRLSPPDLQFVLAHELLHLALRTHERARGSSALEFNYAHDYIINDMLRHALNLSAIPAGGLDMPGARLRNAEEIVLEMRRSGQQSSARSQVWEGVAISLDEALAKSRNGAPGDAGDVLDDKRERELFPGDADQQVERIRAVKELAARGIGLAKAIAAMRGRGQGEGSSEERVRALRGIYRAPWQVALQRFLEGVTPGERTFNRPSRRGAEREDLVMPGRQRYALTLNIVLDTSGSMTNEIPSILGAIADFCEIAGVDDIRLVQCDTAVTGDEVLSSSELAEYNVRGYGGSDLTPAMVRLADDGRVQAAVIITDGDIQFPPEAMPYAVLWAVPGETTSFAPPYGRVITMPRGA